ncbi:MAG: rhomboid family intramembrane serine protease [Alphaproteobacteria bacterium]|nr:rhomboid family intramembrane serine protease [Alphaproteobacteria bacterium]MBV9372046.1 rhomboid family intramembrane serine protease [Alphaproteobacteria bacterium]MBV9899906.1 rhomboid family intramembrane serine protease [Alphaproteobacteria bacterium]
MRPPESWQRAPATVLIAAVTAAAWAAMWIGGYTQAAALLLGFLPDRLSEGTAAARVATALLNPLTATLVHAGFAHLFMNLIIHVYCGRSVEAILGSRALLLIYAVGAYAAAGAQFAAGPHVALPMVGASGAISAVIGAYAMLFGRNRVNVASAVAATFLNALWMIAAWALLQYAVGSLFLTTMNVDIAIAAHVGGFVAGLVLARPLLLWKWRHA